MQQTGVHLDSLIEAREEKVSLRPVLGYRAVVLVMAIAIGIAIGFIMRLVALVVFVPVVLIVIVVVPVFISILIFIFLAVILVVTRGSTAPIATSARVARSLSFARVLALLRGGREQAFARTGSHTLVAIVGIEDREEQVSPSILESRQMSRVCHGARVNAKEK